MAAYDANTERFELVEVKGIKALFTSLRIKRDSVPDSMFCYDVRDSDDGGDPCEITKFVMVNHFGTIITKTPINVIEGEYFLLDDGDFNFLSGAFSLEEFARDTENDEKRDINNAQ